MSRLVVTYTISIDEGGNIYNDVQPFDSSFAEVYKAFLAIKEEVDRQIRERRVCPFNPKYGKGEAALLTAEWTGTEGVA